MKGLNTTDFSDFGTKITGKVRDIYDLRDKLIFITTDRQSAFDRFITLIPGKGLLLNMASVWWFGKTADIVPNHLISNPHANVVVGKKLTIFPVEFVIRGFNTGTTNTSVWTAYEKGVREFGGNILPDGMTKHQQFEKPIITPTTKSDIHDKNITPAEIVKEGLMTQEQFDRCAEYAFKLFQRGNDLVKERGLILVDTKYEFGYDDDGKIYLADEIHTPDSSRWWISKTYSDNVTSGKDPDCIDKDILRRYVKTKCDPYKDEIPEIPKEIISEMQQKYSELFTMITGISIMDEEFDKCTAENIHEVLKEKY